MELKEAIGKGMLGNDIKRRLLATVPGRLADFLERLVYDAIEVQVKPFEGALTPVVKVQVPLTLFVDVPPIGPEGTPPYPKYLGLGDDGKYADTQKTLRACRDYLEACAVQEVLGR